MDMTIRQQFQDDVDEFISDLTTFATGSYLRDEDKELWDEPFDPAVLPELKRKIEAFLDALELLGDDPDGESLARVVTPFYASLEEFKSRPHARCRGVEKPAQVADLRTRELNARLAALSVRS